MVAAASGAGAGRSGPTRPGKVYLTRPRPVVATAHEDLRADLVVLATGVNARAPLDPAWGYRPPHAEMMAQNEITLPGGLSNDRIHIFFDYPPGLIFGALIPKGRYANISLLGHKLPASAISDFLEGQGCFPVPERSPVVQLPARVVFRWPGDIMPTGWLWSATPRLPGCTKMALARFQTAAAAPNGDPAGYFPARLCGRLSPSLPPDHPG
jgi:hypothetical protein